MRRRLLIALVVAAGCSKASAPKEEVVEPIFDASPLDEPEPESADAAAAPLPSLDARKLESDARAPDGGDHPSDASTRPGPDGAPRPDVAAPPPPKDAVPSAACGTGQPAPDGTQTLKNNGVDRTFIVRVPAAYDGKAPWPVIFLWHGAGGSAPAYDRSSGFRRDLGDKAVLVFPQALVYDKTGATTWMRDAADDLAFFDATLAWIKGRVCIDTTRVFAAGHSSGGFWSNTLGCQRGGTIRAIGPVSGGPREMKNCVGSVAAWIAHGTQDTNIPIATGMQGRDFWIQRNGCSATKPVPTSPAPCVAYQGCRTGYPVHWCAFEGGHVWPPFANNALWSFFSSL